MKSKTFTMIQFAISLIIGCSIGNNVEAGDETCEEMSKFSTRTYELYEPNITRCYVYEGKRGKHYYGYNHCSTLAYFNGKFYAAWNANLGDGEGDHGQRIVLAISNDFVHWTRPRPFVSRDAENPLYNAFGRQWQPNLMNYKDKELWCLFYLDGAEEDWDGTYFSKLSSKQGAKWVNRKIFDFNTVTIAGAVVTMYPTQNPTLLESGRVIAPVTLIGNGSDPEKRVQYNAFLYTDDGGETWQVSSHISHLTHRAGVWELYGYEQADGKLRVFMRNWKQLKHCASNVRLTCTGTGTQKGQSLVLEPDSQRCFMEGAVDRAHGFKLSTGRYVALNHDLYCPIYAGDLGARRFSALFFSRSGENDYVAGPRFSDRENITVYPQGIEHDGKIYIVQTICCDPIPRKIEGIVIDPVPATDQFYIWPRDKETIEVGMHWDKPRLSAGYNERYRKNQDYKYTRPHGNQIDNREVIVFKDRATAGVEIDPVDFSKGQSITLSFTAKIEKLQSVGNLIFCSFGDQIPIRIGMPANRPGKLYAYSAEQWERVGEFPVG
ncbi:MAG: sialidase family protein, partial [Planctomycetota bacterium]